MKKLFVAVLAVAALASCAQEDVILNNDKAITFGDAYVANSTRVDYSIAGNLKQFNVYGTVSGTMDGTGTVNIFNGDEVTGTVGNTVWSCDEKQFWIPGADYKFAAVVDAEVKNDELDDYGMPTKLHTKVDGATTGNMHLLDMLYDEETVAGSVVTAEYATPVNFTFKHLLSKVHFTVTSNAEGDYYHKVHSIKVWNYNAGTYTISSTSWDAVGGSVAVNFADIDNVTSSNGETGVTNAELLLVPTSSDFKVEFIVDLYKGTTKLGTINHTGDDKAVTVSNDLDAGFSYNFTIDCSVGKPIQFKVATDPAWGTPTGGDVTIQ